MTRAWGLAAVAVLAVGCRCGGIAPSWDAGPGADGGAGGADAGGAGGGGGASGGGAGGASGEAHLTLTPTTNDFSQVAVGTASPAFAFTLTNDGTGASGTPALALGGAAAADFSVGGDCTGPLAPGQNCTASVTFTPTAAGVRGATLSATASPGGVATASVSGTGLSPAALTVTPSPGDFGTVVVGSPGTLTLTVQNTGGVQVAAPTFSLGGADAALFQFTGHTCIAALAAAATCTVNVQLSPLQAGAANASLTVSAAPAAPVQVPLTGTAQTPGALTIDRTSHGFGGLVQGTTSAPATFTVTNTGATPTGALVVSKSGVDPTFFTTSGCDGQVLGAGATCTLSVTFSPAVPGARAASVSVTGSPGGTVVAQLTGRGLRDATLTLAPSSGLVGQVELGQSGTATFTVTNTGEVSSGVPALAFSGADAALFSVSATTCTAALAPAGTCSVTARFTPAAVGARTATLGATATPGGNATASVSGTGVVTVAVTKPGTGTGRVTSAPAGLDCGTTCSAPFSDASVTLTATPDASSTFTGWGGACSSAGTAATCVLSATAARSATAGFALKQFTITVSKTGGAVLDSAVTGGGMNCVGSLCTAQVAYGGSITLTPVTNAPAAFEEWLSAPCAPTASTCAISNVTRDYTFYARFEYPLVPLTVTAPAFATITCQLRDLGGGYTQPVGPCAPAYRANDTVKLTLVTDSNHVAGDWGGACASAGSASGPCELWFIAGSTPSVTAAAPGKPTPVPYSFTGVSGRIAMNGVEVTGLGPQSFPWGSSVSITLLEDPGVYDLAQGYFTGPCSGPTSASCQVAVGSGAGTLFIFLPQPPAPKLKLTPEAHSFGWNSSPQVQTFQLSNAAGTARTAPLSVQITGISHQGYLTLPSNTAPIAGDCTDGVTRLRPGETCNVRVRFNALSNIDLDNLVVVGSDDVSTGYNVQATAQLYGWVNSGAQDFGASPYNLAFPPTPAGSVSAEQLITLSAFQDDLGLNYWVDPPFEVGPSTTCVIGGGIPAFGSCTLAIRYRPLATGPHRGGVHVNASAFGIKNLALTGLAVCGGAGSKACNGTCVLNTSEATGCGDPNSCLACPNATNGTAACAPLTADGGLECVLACAQDTVLCGTTCETPAPSNGCGAQSCVACSLANVTGPKCTASLCDYTSCNAGWEDLDGERRNGCEAPACASGQKRCNGICVSTSSPATGCQSASCEPCPSQNGTASCSTSGTCQLGCSNGYKSCNGLCVASVPMNGCDSTCTPCLQQHVVGPFCDYFSVPQGSPAICNYASCESGWVDDDGDPANGCEAPAACPTNTKTCASQLVCRYDPAYGCGGTACTPCSGPTSGPGVADCALNVLAGDWACALTCAAGHKVCGTTCRYPDVTAGCGGTDCRSCTQQIEGASAQSVCVAGKCDYFGGCQRGYADLDGNRANGCETATPPRIRGGNLQFWFMDEKSPGPGSSHPTPSSMTWFDQSAFQRNLWAQNNSLYPYAAHTYNGTSRYGLHSTWGKGAWAYMDPPYNSPLCNKPYTVVMAASRHVGDRDDNWALTYFTGRTHEECPGPNSCLFLGYRNATTYTFDQFQNGVDVTIPAMTSSEQFHRVAAVYDPASGHHLYVWDSNNTLYQASSADTQPLFCGGIPTLGLFGYNRYYDNAAYEGDLAEVIIYDAALTQLELTQLQNYLRAKWGH